MLHKHLYKALLKTLFKALLKTLHKTLYKVLLKALYKKTNNMIEDIVDIHLKPSRPLYYITFLNLNIKYLI